MVQRLRAAYRGFRGRRARRERRLGGESGWLHGKQQGRFSLPVGRVNSYTLKLLTCFKGLDVRLLSFGVVLRCSQAFGLVRENWKLTMMSVFGKEMILVYGEVFVLEGVDFEELLI